MAVLASEPRRAHRPLLRSNATHLLCVDSDIGFTAADVQKLLSARRQDFASVCTQKKTVDRLLATPLRNQRQGDLVEAHYAAAGFLLLTRSCVERLIARRTQS